MEQSKTVELDFSKIEIRDLKGNRLDANLNIDLANKLFIEAPTIPFKRQMEELFDKGKVNVDILTVKIIKQILVGSKKLTPLLSEPLEEYLKGLEKELTSD